MRQLYFIGPDVSGPAGAAPIAGPVKIGCSICPRERLSRYLVWSPQPLRLIGAVPGSFQDEAAVKRCFAAERQHHEWFRLTPRLETFIRALIDGRATAAQALAPLERAAA